MDLSKLTRKELLEKCENLGILKYKSKTKNQLILLISNFNGLEIIKENQFDLFQINKTYIQELIKDDYIINFIKDNYQFSNDKNTNIYNFIYSYIKGIKLIHQDYKIFNYSYFNDIIKDNQIKIIWGNCLEKMKLFPNESVGLLCSSPPYYNARDYSTWTNLDDYLLFMTEVIKQSYRILENHRVFVFNISDVVDNDNMNDIKCLVSTSM